MQANYGPVADRQERGRHERPSCDIPSVWLRLPLKGRSGGDVAPLSAITMAAPAGVQRGPKPCRRRCSRKRRKVAVAHCGLPANSSLRLARAERPCRYGSRYNDVHGSEIVDPEVMNIVEPVSATGKSFIPPAGHTNPRRRQADHRGAHSDRQHSDQPLRHGPNGWAIA
jgi:hypothetical protein